MLMSDHQNSMVDYIVVTLYILFLSRISTQQGWDNCIVLSKRIASISWQLFKQLDYKARYFHLTISRRRQGDYKAHIFIVITLWL
jgi:hypothetical protein